MRTAQERAHVNKILLLVQGNSYPPKKWKTGIHRGLQHIPALASKPQFHCVRESSSSKTHINHLGRSCLTPKKNKTAELYSEATAPSVGEGEESRDWQRKGRSWIRSCWRKLDLQLLLPRCHTIILLMLNDGHNPTCSWMLDLSRSLMKVSLSSSLQLVINTAHIVLDSKFSFITINE